MTMKMMTSTTLKGLPPNWSGRGGGGQRLVLLRAHSVITQQHQTTTWAVYATQRTAKATTSVKMMETIKAIVATIRLRANMSLSCRAGPIKNKVLPVVTKAQHTQPTSTPKTKWESNVLAGWLTGWCCRIQWLCFPTCPVH